MIRSSVLLVLLCAACSSTTTTVVDVLDGAPDVVEVLDGAPDVVEVLDGAPDVVEDPCEGADFGLDCTELGRVCPLNLGPQMCTCRVDPNGLPKWFCA